MSTSCTHVLAVIFVLLTTAAIIVAFLTPFWVNNRALSISSGLWLKCSTNDLKNCKWYFENDLSFEKTLPDWFKAAQGLYTCAVVSSVVSLVIALATICCDCHGCNPFRATAFFCNFTFLLMAISMCLFGAKSYLDNNVYVDPNAIISFGWSFWLGVGATGLSLISTILYFCVGRLDRYVI